MDSHTRVALFSYLSLIARLAVGIVFIVYGVEKIPAADAFARNINNYQIMPIGITNIMAFIMPWLEVLCGVGLVLGLWTRASAAVVGGLLIVFIIAISIAMMKHLNIECGCSTEGHGSGMKVGWLKLAEDAGWLVCTLFVFFFPRSKYALDTLFATTPVNQPLSYDTTQ